MITVDNGKEQFTKFTEVSRRYAKAQVGLLGHIGSGSEEMAKTSLLSEIRPMHKEYLDALGAVKKFQEEKMRASKMQAASSIAGIGRAIVIAVLPKLSSMEK